MFEPEHVRAAAGALFIAIQSPGTPSDRVACAAWSRPSLLGEWERRLDDFDREGWRNRVSRSASRTSSTSGLNHKGDQPTNTASSSGSRRSCATTSIDSHGRHIKRAGQFTETVRVQGVLDARQRGDHWMLSVDRAGRRGQARARGADRRDSVVRRAGAQATRRWSRAPSPTRSRRARKIAEVADLQFEGDAQRRGDRPEPRRRPLRARTCSRSPPAARSTAWAEAVDGNDAQLRAIATRAAVRELLHPGDPSGRTRLVVRGPQVNQIRIVGARRRCSSRRR